jgi:predicted metal-dependent peptidase
MDIKIQRAKIDLMLTNPFWGSLITRLQLQDWDGKTFATNGRYLYCPKPKYYNKNWNFQNLIFIMAHETFHCAGGHIFRKGGKKPKLWNKACDYATNALLVENGFQLPDGTLYDKRYDGMTAEKIYNILEQENPNGEGGDEWGEGDVLDPDVNDKGEKDNNVDVREMQEEWKESVTSAVRQAKQRGSIPSGLEEFIDAILFPKVDWQTMLFRYLQIAKGQDDYRAYPFNRNHIWREIYLPSMQGERINLVCAVDTSGSIGTDDLIRYFSELRGIASIFGSYTIHFICADADVHNHQIIEDDSDMPKIAVGRGGTDFRPVFNYVEKNEELQDLPIVYFTDLDGVFPEKWSGDGVFWLIRKFQNNRYDNSHDVPFGTIIEIDE